MEKICQSCGMIMKDDNEFGTNENGSLNEEYCTYCYQQGKFTKFCTMEEMIESNLNFLDEFNNSAKTNFDEKQAREEMLKFFPTLKRWHK